MKMIDSFLMKYVYQALVNLTQKKRGWWVEQCAYAWWLVNLAMLFIDKYPPEHYANSPMINAIKAYPWVAATVAIVGIIFMVLTGALLGLVFYTAARHDHLMDKLATERSFSLCLVAAMLSISVFTDGDAYMGYRFIHAIYLAVFLSVFYFSACKPPTERKARFVPQT